jgi:hypothetical protein
MSINVNHRESPGHHLAQMAQIPNQLQSANWSVRMNDVGRQRARKLLAGSNIIIIVRFYDLLYHI